MIRKDGQHEAYVDAEDAFAPNYILDFDLSEAGRKALENLHGTDAIMSTFRDLTGSVGLSNYKADQKFSMTSQRWTQTIWLLTCRLTEIISSSVS